MTYVGLKWGQDLENRAARPHQEYFPSSPPPLPPSLGGLIEFLQNHKFEVLLFCAMKAWQREQKTTTHLLF